MDKSLEVVKREALAAVLSAAREMLRQVVVPAATGRVENLARLEAAYVELSGAMERLEEAELPSFVQGPPPQRYRALAPTPAVDAFTCRCAEPVPGQLDVCCVCGAFVPDVPARAA